MERFPRVVRCGCPNDVLHVPPWRESYERTPCDQGVQFEKIFQKEEEKFFECSIYLVYRPSLFIADLIAPCAPCHQPVRCLRNGAFLSWPRKRRHPFLAIFLEVHQAERCTGRAQRLDRACDAFPCGHNGLLAIN